MSSDYDRQKRIRPGLPASTFQRIERLPPVFMFLYMALVAITVMFAILVLAYAHSRLSNGEPTGLYSFPRYFSLSTLVLLVSSYTLAQANRLYRADDLANLGRCLGATLLLSCIFIGLQLLGWRELLHDNVFFTGESSGTYIYLISALHVVHLLGGMLFLLVLLIRVVQANRDAVRELVFIRDRYRVRQLRLLGTYWHFIGALWVGLFAAFLFLY